MCVVAGIAVAGCAASTRVVVAPSPLAQHRRVLELRLAQVRIHRERLSNALLRLDAEISRQLGRTRSLSFALSVGIGDPQVSFEAHDVTVRALLEAICHQSGLNCEIGSSNSPYDLYVDQPKQP
jgi:hypothetical protein